MVIQFKDYLQKLILRIIAVIIVISPLMLGSFNNGQWIIIQGIIGVTLVFEFYKKYLNNQEHQRITFFDVFNYILIFIYFISIIWGLNKHGAYITAFRYLSFYFFFYLTINNVNTKEDRNFVIHSIIFSAFLTSLVAFLSLANINFFGVTIISSIRMSGTIGYPNTFAVFMALAFILGIELLLNSKSKFVTAYLYGALHLMVAGIVASQSRGVFVFLVIFMSVLFIYHIVKRQKTSQFFYNFFFISAIGAFTVSAYITQITAGENAKALIFLCLGVGIAVSLGIFTEFVRKKLDRINKDGTYKGLFFAFVLIYMIGIGVLYFNYVSKVDPTSGGVFLNPGVTGRLGEISGEEGSYTTRMTYNKDALKIILNNPLGTGGRGWDSAYHQYQDYEYWSREAHNNFLNVGVESGVLGFLVYLAMWGAVFFGGYRTYKVKRVEENNIHIALIVALGLLLAHGGMDFDFSYGFINLLGMTIAALILYREKSRKLLVKDLKVPKMAWGVLSLVVVIGFLLPTGVELVSERYIKRGYQAWELDKIIVNYEKSVKYSPFNEHSSSLLARKYAEKFLKTGDNQYYDKVNELTDRVIKLAPRDIWSLINIQDAQYYIKNQRKLLELREIEAAMMPVVSNTNAALGDEYIKTALLEYGEGNIEEAFVLFEKASLVIEPYLNAEKINPYLDQKARLTPAMYHGLVVGKIYYLEGDYDKALSILKEVNQGSLLDESLVWQVATYIRNGNTDQGELLINRIKNQDMLFNLNKIVNSGGIFAKETEVEEDGRK
ncbi:MAG: O-antigen ligase family protein [Eubacteriales bacterium]|nr:O-antigen ligase family protein [Eubacteriales bacterium]